MSHRIQTLGGEEVKLSVTGADAQREMGVKAGPEMGIAIKKLEANKFKELI